MADANNVPLIYLVAGYDIPSAGLLGLASGVGVLVRGSARGSLVLMVGQVITTVISALTIIWIARTIGDENYGMYTVALVPVSLLMLLQDLGVSQALMRYCSLYRHEGRSGLRSMVLSGLMFSGAISLFSSVLLYIYASNVAAFYQRPDLAPLMQAAAFSVLGQGLLTTVQAILAGYELMSLRSLSQIIFSIIRAFVGVGLVIFGFGAFGAISSYTVALVLTGLISVGLVFAFVKFGAEDGGPSFSTLRMLLLYGFPLSVGALLVGVLNQINQNLMVLYVPIDVIGNYGAAVNFGVLVSFMTTPIGTVLFPLFSKFKRDDPRLETLYKASVKYTSMITLPVVFGIIVIAAPLSRIIFTNEYNLVPVFLSLYILLYAFEGLGGISLSNLISGLGESRVILISTACTFAAGAALAFILIPSYQVIGLIAALLIANRVGWLYQAVWARRNLGYGVDVGSTVKVYASALAAFVVSFAVVNLLSLQGWVALLLGGLSLLAVYVVALPLSGALVRADLQLLDEIVEGFGPLVPLVRIFLAQLGRLVRA